MDRNHFKRQDGDRINALLAVAGFTFHLLRSWFSAIWRAWVQAWLVAPQMQNPPELSFRRILHGRRHRHPTHRNAPLTIRFISDSHLSMTKRMFPARLRTSTI